MTYQVTLTATGAAKLAAGIVNLTHMALGDGGGSEYDPDGTEIALVNEVYRQPLSAYNVTANKVIMQLSVPITDGGFSIREAGVFDTDGDMIYIANLATRYKPLPTEGGASDLSITLVTTVSNIANLTVTVDGTAYITQTVLTAELANKIDKVDDKATAAEAEAATDTDKFMTPETTYAAYGASDPVVLTTSPHNQLITESILTGSAAPMVINLADVATYPKSKLNRIALTIANLSNKNWTITPAAGSGALSETLSITGSTTTPPTYALDATSLPTVTNGTIASNLFTATANNASAQTFDYVAGGTVESITPQMKFVPGTVLTVDPASTTGSTKFNYSASNTVQMGSKLLVDVAGTVSEITVAAGSQTGSGITTSGNLIPYVFSNGEIRIYVSGSNKFVKTNTSFGYLTLTTNTLPSGITFFGLQPHIKLLNGKYYLCGQVCDGVYETSDFETYTKVYNSPYASASMGLTIVGSTMYVFIRDRASASTNCTIVNTADGTTYNSVSTPTFTVSPASASLDSVFDFVYAGTDLLVCTENGVGRSVDNGVTWTFNRADSDATPNSSGGFIGINKIGSTYVVACYNRRQTALSAFMTSTDFTTWTSPVTGITFNTLGNIVMNNAGTTLYCQRYSTSSLYISTNGSAWTTAATATGTGYQISQASGFMVHITASPNLNYSANDGVTWQTLNLNTFNGYTFTMTSPSIAVPTWAALGGQTEQYSVTTTSTPSFIAATTPTYTRSGNVITATYAQATGTSGVHVQLKALTLNSGDALSQIGATLEAGTLQTINGKTGLILAPGKVAMLTPTADGWLSDRDNVTGKVITTNYTMTAADDIVVLGANNLTATLPDATAVEPWKVYKVKAGDFTGGIIATQSGQTVDGTTPPTLNALDSLNVYSNGANWLID